MLNGCVRDERAANDRERAIVARVQVLAERHRAAEVVAQVPGRGARQVVIELIVDERAFGDTSARRDVGALGRTSFDALVVRVVGAERVVELEPAVRDVLGVDVAERAVRLLIVELELSTKNGLSNVRVCPAVSSVAFGNDVRAMQSRRRIEIRQVVEVRRRAEQSEQQAVHVVAALRQVAARIGEREVAADREPVRQMVRRVEPRRRAIVEVVRTDEHALVVVVVPREVERRALVAAGHAQRVVENVSRVERLVRVIEAVAGDRRAPTARHGLQLSPRCPCPYFRCSG